jgi:hypothetical protein
MGEKDLIVALKQGRLNIDCVRMELVQNSQHEPVKYIGGGYIKQDDNGVIIFKIYTKEIENVNAASELVRTFNEINKSGTIYSKNNYYSLVAKSYEHETWKAERILLDGDCNVDWRQSDPCVHGKLHVITCSEKIENKEGKHDLTMRFFDEVDIPCIEMTEFATEAGLEYNRDTVRFSAANVSFHMQKLDKEIVVKVNSDIAFSQDFELSIIEALRYVLARNIFYRVLIKSDEKEKTVHLFSALRQSAKPQLDGPLLPTCPDRSMFWRLFSRYLEYVIRERSLNGECRCARHLYTAVEASANSYYAWSMGVCVAVEGIAYLVNNEESPDEQYKKEQEELKKQKEEIIAHINEWLKSKCWTKTTMGQRTTGLISNLNQERVIDRLSPLVQNKTIDGSLIKAWKDLRHPGAHAAEIIDETDPSCQKFFDNLNKVTTLMYLITFHLIDYKEGYKDYSTHGWPIKYVK